MTAVRKTRAQQHRAFLHQARKDYDRLLAAQGGRCALCGREPREGEKYHVDHAHGARKLTVRGILCPFAIAAYGVSCGRTGFASQRTTSNGRRREV